MQSRSKNFTPSRSSITNSKIACEYAIPKPADYKTIPLLNQ